MEKAMFTAKEAVTEYFQGTISYTKLLQDFKQGKIPGVKLSAKRILFRKEALDNWMKSMEKERVSKAHKESYAIDKDKSFDRSKPPYFKRVKVF